MNRRFGMYAMIAAAVLMTSAGAIADNGNNNETRLRTKLTGAVTQGKAPEGSADFRSDAKGRMRLNVEVEQTGLPKGTMLTVTLTHAAVTSIIGTITISGGSAELELDSQDGMTVPAIQSGDVITVSNGAIAILAGVF